MQPSGKGTQKQMACGLLPSPHAILAQAAQEAFPQPRGGKADQPLTTKRG